MLGLRCYAGFSLVVASRGCCLTAVHGLLISVASLVAEPGLWSSASVVMAPALVALWHVGPSWIRNWTHDCCTGRRILYNWATREAFKKFWDRECSLQKGCTNLHSFLHTLAHIINLSYLCQVFRCSNLNFHDYDEVDYFFRCLLAIYSFTMSCLYISFSHFPTGILFLIDI